MGVRYLHQGRTRAGVDCAGFVVAVLQEQNLLPPKFRDTRDYGRHPQGTLVEMLAAYCTKVAEPVAGDLVAIRWPRDTVASHLAVYTGADGHIVHAFGKARAVVETSYGRPWTTWTDSYWRVPKVTA